MTSTSDHNAGANDEACDNGLDDDDDGQIDEECACTTGATQACWPGSPDTRGIGPCRDGVQTCTGQGEFTSWGACEGAALPSPDRAIDGIDQDCSGGDGPSATCTARETTCQGGQDEDCDGLVDCADADCAGTSGCPPAVCPGQCVPGFARWCDSPDGCTWGRQTCTPAGTWGSCIETSAPSGCYDDFDDEYDTDCCAALADACCQNYPANDSIGECGGNGTCP